MLIRLLGIAKAQQGGDFQMPKKKSRKKEVKEKKAAEQPVEKKEEFNLGGEEPLDINEIESDTEEYGGEEW